VSETVVVGYDGQELSERVLDRAIEAVKAAGSGKVVVAVAEELPPPGYDLGAPPGMYDPGAFRVAPVLPDPDTPMPGVQEILERGLQRLREAGVQGEPAWGIGDPADVILEAARKHGASTIMVGAHHRGLFAGLFEDVGKELRRDAQCEVVVVE
jgi:nucleotide-binding universal stress UspA family protein